MIGRNVRQVSADKRTYTIQLMIQFPRTDDNIYFGPVLSVRI
jgi:hypothetical protein